MTHVNWGGIRARSAAPLRFEAKNKEMVEEVRKADGSKLQLYRTLDSTDYCPHTAFAAALPQVISTVGH